MEIEKILGLIQLIYIEKEMDKYVPITIFNSDGNEVDACGNGSRCIIALLLLIDSTSKKEYDNSKKTISLKTKNSFDWIFDWQGRGPIGYGKTFI